MANPEHWFNFDFSGLDDLEINRDRMIVRDTPKGPIRRSHYDPLLKSGCMLQATAIARANARELAEGYGDLALLVLEPGDRGDKLKHRHSGGLPRTINIIDEQLKAVSHFRSWHNTCIIDARSYRSRQIRELQPNANAREERDEIAYKGCELSIEELQPDVLIVLQSSAGRASNDFIRHMSSSTSRCRSVFLRQLRSNKWMVVVHSLHPMYAEKYTESAEPMIRHLRRAMIRFSFLQATNIMSGRIIVGVGVKKLCDAVWGAGQTRHLLTRCGTLDPAPDRGFKGIFLPPAATLEVKRVWEECMLKRELEVSPMRIYCGPS